jgi:hypothetical protein
MLAIKNLCIKAKKGELIVKTITQVDFPHGSTPISECAYRQLDPFTTMKYYFRDREQKPHILAQHLMVKEHYIKAPDINPIKLNVSYETCFAVKCLIACKRRLVTSQGVDLPLHMLNTWDLSSQWEKIAANKPYQIATYKTGSEDMITQIMLSYYGLLYNGNKLLLPSETCELMEWTPPAYSEATLKTICELTGYPGLCMRMYLSCMGISPTPLIDLI